MNLPAVYEVYFQEQVCDARNISNRQGLQLFSYSATSENIFQPV